MNIHAIPQAEGVTYPAGLQKKLRAALEAKGPDYRPRTRHVLPDGSPRYTNRLIAEHSPYLLQHAHNPVDWHPWGEAAFARAGKENKSVFLSIGYSTCHWCHVMEEQSFENPEIAAVLNRDFIAIKVDREQLPDVDATYMSAVQWLTGGGGWPLSAFLTPEGRLFYGGTYFPPARFRQLLLQIAEAWRTQRPVIDRQADEIARAVARLNVTAAGAAEAGIEEVGRALKDILGCYDREHGGFGQAPKFPNEPWLFLLLDELWRSDDATVRRVLTHTLDAMARGGIYDQVGGGFHRYATDAAWRVPHFEKMLYNQAQLGLVYAHTAVLTANPFFARVARQTFDYVLREMTAPEGGFYSATDADSEGGEGRFFVWTPKQIRAALPPGDADFALEVFGVTQQGNFEGHNILYLARPLSDFARLKGVGEAEFLRRLDAICSRLHAARNERIPPLRDDKVITAWNGMMIVSLAEAARLLHQPRYFLAAKKAAEFLWRNHYRDGRLMRASLHGWAGGEGMQEDYAWLALGMLSLYDGSWDRAWVRKARILTDGMLAKFWDEDQGAFFMSPQGADPLMVRPKEIHDGAIPSGNAVAARLLARLRHRAPQLLYQTRFHGLIKVLSEQIRRGPAGFAFLLTALRESLQGEPGPLQYAARGNVRVSAMASRRRLEARLLMRPGWHLNGPQTSADRVPTRLDPAEPDRGWRIGAVHYSPAESVTLPFSARPLALYRHRAVIAASVTHAGSGPLGVRLRLQSCDDRHCLAPEDLKLEVPLPLCPNGL